MKHISPKMLFIAYFYPPVVGFGIPGAQRTIKFLKNLKLEEYHVLSIFPEKYPDHIEIDKKTLLHFDNIQVHRAGCIDLFEILLKLRKLFAKAVRRNDFEESAPVDSHVVNTAPHKTGFQKLKDNISDLITYPDYAYPWFVPALFQGRRIIKNHDIDIIFATGIPWTAFLIGYFLKLLTGKKLIVDFRDPWVGNPYAEKGRLVAWLDRRWEAAVVQKADMVVANTEALKNEMEKRYWSIKDKFFVVTNGYDVGDFQNIPKISLPSEKLIISHAGFLYPKRDPISLIKAIEIIKNKNADLSSMIQFNQIGYIDLQYALDDYCSYDLNDYCREKGIQDNIILHEQMDHKKCLGYLIASDVLLLIQPDTMTQIPSKFFEYIYIEKPILAIAPRSGALGKLILRHGFGEVLEPNEHDKIADFLYKLAQEKKEKGRLERKYPNKELFNITHIASNFEKYIRNI